MIVGKTKQWGNSVGIIIPKDVAKEKGIRAEDEVLFEIEKKNKKQTVLQDLAGTLKAKKSTEQILKEVRKDLESKYL